MYAGTQYLSTWKRDGVSGSSQCHTLLRNHRRYVHRNTDLAQGRGTVCGITREMVHVKAMNSIPMAKGPQ